MELGAARVARMAGAGAREAREALPYLGLDVEERPRGAVRAEYSPNRPDYSTEYGVAAGLRALLTGRAPPAAPRARPAAGARVVADRRAAALRPAVTAVLAEGGRLGARGVGQLVSMQEDLHAGIGRGRARSAIGLHDAAAVRFPVRYAALPRGARFEPLGLGREATVGEALSGTPAGRAYGRLAAGPLVPALVGADGEVLSVPPVVNCQATALSARTRSVFAEVTGASRRDVEDALAVVAFTLSEAGFALRRVAVSGAGNATPRLAARRMRLPSRLVEETLGVPAPPARLAAALRRAGLEARAARGGAACLVPPHRFDVLGPADLVEEAMLGHGVQNIEPGPPGALGPGSPSGLARAAARASDAMVGLGYTEAQSPSLGPAGPGRGPRVASQGGAGPAALRASLLPGLLSALSRSVHLPYPQRLFEAGPAFPPGGEEARLCAVAAHSGASYAEAKAALAAVLAEFGARCSTPPGGGGPLASGRSARVVVGGRDAGRVGEASAAALAAARIRVPVAAFEVSLAGLISGGARRRRRP